MIKQLFSNNAISLLKSDLTPSSTSLVLHDGYGALFPQPNVANQEFFLVTLESVDVPLVREIVKITGRTGDVLQIAERGCENTPALAWQGGEHTLVDHRLTAETIRQAFLNPEPTNTGGSGSINVTPDPVLVETGWNLEVFNVKYSHLKRGHKFWVTVSCIDNGFAQTFEVLAVVQGLLGSGNEIIDWTRHNRIGYNFKGNITLELDLPNNELNIKWHNTEPIINVEVAISHLSL